MINVTDYISPENIHKCENCVVAAGMAVATGLSVWRIVFAEFFAAAVAWAEERQKLRRVKELKSEEMTKKPD